MHTVHNTITCANAVVGSLIVYSHMLIAPWISPRLGGPHMPPSVHILGLFPVSPLSYVLAPLLSIIGSFGGSGEAFPWRVGSSPLMSPIGWQTEPLPTTLTAKLELKLYDQRRCLLPSTSPKVSCVRQVFTLSVLRRPDFRTPQSI